MLDLSGATAAPTSINVRRTIVLAAVAATVLALLGPAVRPAAAHTHPTPVDVSEPAVVRVETYVQVFISLIEHDRHGKHIGLFQKRYELLANAGSGFAVEPSGVIVAAGGVIEADTRKAQIEAVNRIFHDRYGNRAPIPAKPASRYTIRHDDPSDPLNGRLQRCYVANTADTTGGCVIATDKVIRVYPYVVSPRSGTGTWMRPCCTPRPGRRACRCSRSGPTACQRSTWPPRPTAPSTSPPSGSPGSPRTRRPARTRSSTRRAT